LERGFADYLFAFGTDFVAGWVFIRVRLMRRSFGCEDYSFVAGRSGVVPCWGFDAEAQEHVAAAEVGLGSVVESVLFLDAGSGLDA